MLDDGRLEVLVAHGTAQASEVIICGEAVPHCPDGEVSDPVSERTYRFVPGALQLIR